MTIIINILLFILILGIIVFIHELGHFTWAKITKVYVYEFAIGMGPKIFSYKGKETTYSLRAIPIGGYCSLAGENTEYDDEAKIPKKRRLQNKKIWERFLIMFFGAGNNFISAFLILFFIALVWGASTMDPIITKVDKTSPAYEEGIKPGDKILKINKEKVKSSDDASLLLAISSPKEKNEIIIKTKSGEVKEVKIKPKKVKIKDKERYIYGIQMTQKKEYGIVPSFNYMIKKGTSLFRQMYLTLKYLILGDISLSQLSGPVGIYSIVGEQRTAGLASILFLVAYLSINVGFINLMPLPAFDGGHILFILIELVRGKPVSPKFETTVHTIGIILLMLLMVIVTINDIIKLF